MASRMVNFTVDTTASPLSITSYAPSSSVSDSTGATRTFNIKINQVVNVTWYLNGTQLFTNTSVTEANYTNSSAGSGTWNVTAIVNNTNGTDSQEWAWIVMKDNMPSVITISVPFNNANISIFDRIISGSITDDSAITANMYVNSLFTNTWGSKGSFRWPNNFMNGSNTINISATDAHNNINWTNISVFVLSPVNESSVNLTANQSLNITANDSTGVDVVLSTGNNTANITVKINASINASHFNISDIDTEFVALGIARKSLVKFVDINATGDVVNLSGVKITMFYNDSDLDLNGNGIIDAGDIKEDTLNLYWHWGNDTSGSQEWFPLTLGADYSGKFDRNNNSGPIVISVEKNTAFKYISVSTDHFSIYSIAGASIPATPTTTTTTTTGSSGSGTGGSGVVTAEPYENIALSEMIERNLEPGKPVTYTFTKNQDVIYEVLVTGKENEYDVSMRIEILKNRSKQAKENAPGLVYRNANIISGTKNIGENVIKFKVNDSWLLENGFDSSDIRLVKWVDNKWITLETGVLFNKDGYTHFSAKSMTFSTYAITGIKKEEMMPSATEKTAVTPEAAPLSTEEQTPQPEGKTPLWIWMILAMLLVAGLVYVLKRK
jgi:PGF-pre-PGF domain-containing protein